MPMSVISLAIAVVVRRAGRCRASPSGSIIRRRACRGCPTASRTSQAPAPRTADGKPRSLRHLVSALRRVRTVRLRRLPARARVPRLRRRPAGRAAVSAVGGGAREGAAGQVREATIRLASAAPAASSGSTRYPPPRKVVQLAEPRADPLGARRHLPADLPGRPRAAADPEPTWNGYSVGRWEGDTLVVQTNGLRDGTWIDRKGSPLTARRARHRAVPPRELRPSRHRGDRRRSQGVLTPVDGDVESGSGGGYRTARLSLHRQRESAPRCEVTRRAAEAEKAGGLSQRSAVRAFTHSAYSCLTPPASA